MKVAIDNATLLAICAIDGIDWAVLARACERPGGLERLLEGEIPERSPAAARARERLRPALASGLERERERAAAELAAGRSAGASLLTVLDEHYPANLRLAVSHPPFLFVRGSIVGGDGLALAVVGARAATPAGLRHARGIARDLVGLGTTVVSGLARGIDSAAHGGALEAGGRTLAVLGTGVLHCYPPENADLADRIAASGALVSPYWPTQAPTVATFPARNAVTSAIAQGTLVIEAGPRSGARMQARLALEQGRRLFLSPWLLEREEWAREHLALGALPAGGASEITARLRAAGTVRALAEGRRQLALDLGR